MTYIPAVVLSFFTVVLGLGGIYSFVSDVRAGRRSRLHNWLDEEARKRQDGKTRTSALFKGLKGKGPELAEDEEASPTMRRRFEIMLEQSGLSLGAGRLLLISAVLCVVPPLVVAVVRHSLLVEAVVALLGAVGPIAYVNQRRNSRMNEMQGQIPEAFDTMSRVLRAGNSLGQALKAVAKGHVAPIATEFGYCHEQLNLGLSPDRTLRDLSGRTGLLEFKILAMGTSVQQRSGGNLAELMDKLAAVARERLRTLSKIKTMTAEGRLQAMILLALPPIVFVALLILKPEYSKKLLDHPMLLVATGIAQLIGSLWIRKIVNATA